MLCRWHSKTRSCKSARLDCTARLPACEILVFDNMRLAFLCFLTATLPAQTVEFNRNVRPILSDKCWSCHGTDAAAKGIRLRLDQEASAQAARSLIADRIATDNKARRMPPAHIGNPLSTSEIATLRSWAEAGAPWQTHWAYLAPTREAGRGIDHFVKAKLATLGLKPSPPAQKETLLRRLSLDLTGLPPTPAELDSNASYEATVDRLLASPRFAERMTARWLDASRYADTNGYQTDGERVMWRWRDWVIDAFARNMPFDQFILEQMAGDLLPNATLSQRIATGFQRNHRGNGEGGIIAAEYLAEYAADRVETMSTVFLGSTVGCARCHNHKYDPFSQKDFYQFFAYFHNIGERGRYFKYGNTPPFIPAPTTGQQAQLQSRAAAIRKAEAKLKPGEAQGPLNWKPTLDLIPLDKAAPSYTDRFTVAAQFTPQSTDATIIAKTVDTDEPMGFSLLLKMGHLQVNLVQRWLDDAIRVETERTLVPGQPHHVAFTYDGSKLASGLILYIDGKPEKVRILVDELNQDFIVKEPLKIGGTGVADPRIYGRSLPPLEVAFLAGTATGAEARRRQFLETKDSTAWAELTRLRRERDAYLDEIPTVMVMQEMPQPLDAHILIRGAYDLPGETVAPGVPSILGKLPTGSPNNRLGLARWLIDRSNPLTARVTVNRFWQSLFGAGIVKTSEDFGAQGEWPSHPELLDWLAVEFMDSGWNVKHLIKTIVLSDTYRQSSQLTPELLARDPENRLLARGPRLRLDAGQVRDQALFVSGLLVEKQGGPSVKPYQPAGLWKELSGGTDYQIDKGEGLYRRSLYTFWKRTSPPPAMANFDAAGRETCIVRESRTNTPLQALNLMNDVTFLEASRKLAERMLQSKEGISFGFRLITSRLPSTKELAILNTAYRQHLATYNSNPTAARNLLAHGDSTRDPKLDPAVLAAHTLVASMLLNLDEGITRE